MRGTARGRRPCVGAGAQAPAGTTEVHEHVEVAGTLLTPTTDVSGTAWLPLTTPMYGVHREWRGWDIRIDGSVFAQLVYEPGERPSDWRRRDQSNRQRQLGDGDDRND